MIPIDVSQTDDGFSVISKVDLPPGEYMLVQGNNPTGYDFSVRR